MMTLHPSSSPLSAVQERVLWILKLTNDYEICCDGRDDLHEKIKVGEGKYFECHTENASFRSMLKKPVVKTGLRTVVCTRKTFSCGEWNRKLLKWIRAGASLVDALATERNANFLIRQPYRTNFGSSIVHSDPFSEESFEPSFRFNFEAELMKSTHSGQSTTRLSFHLTLVCRLPISQEFASFANIFDCCRP